MARLHDLLFRRSGGGLPQRFGYESVGWHRIDSEVVFHFAAYRLEEGVRPFKRAVVSMTGTRRAIMRCFMSSAGNHGGPPTRWDTISAMASSFLYRDDAPPLPVHGAGHFIQEDAGGQVARHRMEWLSGVRAHTCD